MKHIITLCDSYSKFVLAKMASVNESQLILDLSSFVFSTFCQYGFTKCILLSCKDLYRPFVKRFSGLWTTLSLDSITSASPSDFCTHEHELRPASQDLAILVESFVSTNYDTWDILLDSWLFQQRTSVTSLG
jgi:hypothetical protein